MTAPALTDSERASLKVLVTAAALAYHDTTVPEGERVDVIASYAVHGDLRLVAADVLETACLYAQGHPETVQQAALKKIKIGPIELERAASSTVAADQVNASAWCERAARLRKEAGSLTGLIRSPLAGMVSGSSPDPVFCVTRNQETT